MTNYAIIELAQSSVKLSQPLNRKLHAAKYAAPTLRLLCEGTWRRNEVMLQLCSTVVESNPASPTDGEHNMEQQEL
jgi:hypothetical protein